MSFKTKLLAGAASLVVLSGVGAAGALSASGATPSCGTRCLDVYNKKFGKQYELDVFRQAARVGQPVILFSRSNADPAQDFTVSDQGTVSDFFAAGMVSPQVMLHYGCTPGFVFSNGQGATITCPANTADEQAGELEYAPDGRDTGLCVGVGAARLPGAGTAKVSLQPCGQDARTVWILDGVDVCNNFAFGKAPVISGADTNFSHPSVLTYPQNGNPVDKPRPQLTAKNLTGFSQNGPPSPNPSGCQSIVGADDTQLWSAYLGIAK